MEIPTEVVYGILISTVSQLGVSIYGYGRLNQKVSNLTEAIKEIKDRLDSVYVCKYHSDVSKELGRLDANQKVVMKKNDLL